LRKILGPHSKNVPVSRKIISVAVSRSGTLALYNFFAVYGVNSYHQRHYQDPKWSHSFNVSRSEIFFQQHILSNPPDNIKKIIDRMKLPVGGPPDDHFFVSTWAAGEGMYQISKKFPDIEWFIVIRDISDVCNSLRRFVNKKDGMSQIDVDYWAWLYLLKYHFYLKQAKEMETTPYLIKFDRMVKGEYDKFFLTLFGLDYDKEKSNSIWNHKFNSLGDYNVDQVDPLIMQNYKKLKIDLERVCRRPLCL
jgi:hypothetical protein